MKASKNKKSGVKRLSILAVLLLSTYTISANPLTYILGADSTGLDAVYILMGISGISLLLFFPESKVSNEIKQDVIQVRSNYNNDFSNYRRKVVKKTS